MNDWVEAEQRVERAQQLCEVERWEEALYELDQAIAINPHNALWHAQRGFLLEELDRCGDAASAYERSLKLEPGDKDVAMALGVVLARQGRFTHAVEILTEVARQNPGFEPAYCYLIRCYAELGMHQRAEEMFYLAQELDDACPHCFYHLGSSLAVRGQVDRAIYCWRKVLELEPGYLGVNRRIGQASVDKGDLEQAREYYLRELREDPGNTDLLLELGQVALRSGQWEAAAAKFEQILELEPDHGEARLSFGKLLLQMGRHEQALVHFERLASASGKWEPLPELEWRRGEALMRLGRPKEARHHLVRALGQDPANIEIRMILGDALFDCHDLNGAADCYRRVLALDAEKESAHYKLAQCHFTFRRFQAALEHARRAMTLNAQWPDPANLAAHACIRLGKWRAARQLLRGVLEIDPNSRDARRTLGRLWVLRLQKQLKSLVDVFKNR